jgi:hypothetical protein
MRIEPPEISDPGVVGQDIWALTEINLKEQSYIAYFLAPGSLLETKKLAGCFSPTYRLTILRAVAYQSYTGSLPCK